MRTQSDELTPREWAEFNNEKEILKMQMDHARTLKELEIEVQKLEARWSSWLKLPLALIKLPVRLLLIIPLSIYAGRKQEVPQELWNLLS